MQEEDKPRNEDEILALCLERLRGKLPPGWDSMVLREGPAAAGLADGLLRITAPDGTQATFVLKVKISATTKAAVVAVDQMIRILAESEETNWMPLFVTGYLPPRTRELLNQRGVGWIDTTGNLRIISSSPGLFIEATGAIRDPWPDDQPLRSLRGRGSARAVRAVVDFTPPYGVRELSTTARVPAPTLSRVLELLTQEMIVERDAAGGVVDVDWEAAIRRWSKDKAEPRQQLPRAAWPRLLRPQTRVERSPVLGDGVAGGVKVCPSRPHPTDRSLYREARASCGGT